MKRQLIDVNGVIDLDTNSLREKNDIKKVTIIS